MGRTMVEGGGSATLQEQIMTLKQKTSKAETEIKAADTKITHNTEQIKKKTIEMKKTEAVYKRDSGNLGKLEKEEADLLAKLAQMKYEEGTLEKLEGEQRPMQHRIQGLRQTVEGAEARFSGLRFDYRDPERNFDRRKVFGVAAKLFTIKDDPDIDFSVGLEAVAGGKLYNVVTETDQTATALLERGNLGRRFTFIPLNKMSGRNNGGQKLAAALKVGGQGNVWAPMDLVQYDRQVEPAILHLFGSGLLVRDLNTANRVAFHPSVGVTCYTLEGDMVSAGGDMSGGAQKAGGSVLAELGAVRGKQEELVQAQRELDEVRRRIQEVQGVAERWNTFSQQLEVKQAELGMIRQRLEQTAHHQLAEEVKAMEASTEAVKQGVEQAKVDKPKWAQEVKDLQYRIDNAEKIRDSEMKKADKEVKDAKKKADESKAKWSEQEQEERSIRMELEELRNNIAATQESLEALGVSMKRWGEQITAAEDQLSEAQDVVKAAKQEVKQQKDNLAAQNKEIQTKNHRCDQLKKQKDEAALEEQKLEHDVKKRADEVRDAERR